MSKSKDIIGLVVHEEFTKARKAIETSLDEKLGIVLKEGAIGSAIGGVIGSVVPGVGTAIGSALGNIGGELASAGMNKMQQASQTGTMQEGGCQGEDCMHEDEEEDDKDEEDDDHKKKKTKKQEDEGDEDEEDEGDEDEEDEGDEDEESPEDASMKSRQAIIGFRAANKKGDKREMNEAKGLKGNQKKLDVAPPFGKLTGTDFKKLRNKGK